MNRALILVALFLLGCSGGNSGTVVATGTLEAVEVDVAPLVPGRVVRVLVNEGDSVKAGQTVAELTQPTSQAAVAQSRAQVQASRAALTQAETGPRAAEIRRATAELNAATAEVARTSKDLERARTLARTGSIPLQQRDAAEAAARQAGARREAARQTLLLLQQGSRPEEIARARAQVAGAEAGLSGTVASVNDLVLVAPVAGVVLSRNAEPGEVLPAGQSAVTIGEIQRPWVRVYVNENDLPGIAVGSVARGVLDGMPNRSFTGRVVSINSKAEFTPRVALTDEERADLMFGVKVEFDGSSGALKPGLPITVSIPKKPAPPKAAK
jgi:HlyD family secretion protein